MKEIGFKFDNSFLSLPEGFYTRLDPVPVKSPEMVLLNHELARSMGLDFSDVSPKEQAALFAGNKIAKGAEPFAQAYAGHQFGNFTMLGDGRAHVWGEHIKPDGSRVDIQYKGSGQTPYSRRGDGRAALAPMLREYIISEAMHALNIPTTRSLAVIKTGEDVMREIPLPGAILTRVASSHIRVGTFEFAAAQGDQEIVELLLDYTIKRHELDLDDAQNKALAFLDHVMEAQADLITHWMRVGFIHGVMNTDNMSLSNETIDYGPCAFMDAYEPNTVFSSIDHMGRYAYSNQPIIAQWNISRLAEAILPLIDKDIGKAIEKAEKAVNKFPALFKTKWLNMMRAKIGLFAEEEGDEKLISDLLNLMQRSHADYTNSFNALTHLDTPIDTKEFSDWKKRWQARLDQNDKAIELSQDLMRSFNPIVIPRNHLVEEALEAATEGDMKPLLRLLEVIKKPYEESDYEALYRSPPEPSERVYQTFCGT